MLANSLPQLKKLTALDISGSPLGDEGCANLTTALSKCTALQSLCLARCSVGDAGAKSVATLFGQHPTLSKLYLGVGSQSNKQLLDQCVWGPDLVHPHK